MKVFELSPVAKMAASAYDHKNVDKSMLFSSQFRLMFVEEQECVASVKPDSLIVF